MCETLKISRAGYYYEEVTKNSDIDLENAIVTEFNLSRRTYGTRKLKRQLSKEQNGHKAYFVSRIKIARIMNKRKLVSKYTLKRDLAQPTTCNNDSVDNLVAGKFKGRNQLEVVISDLTYVKCGGKWHYICLILDLHSRKIIGSAVGCSKDAKLVRKALYSVRTDLRKICVFHTDRGSKFKNKIIYDILSTERSLFKKGTPTDNAVAESMYNILKTEFVFDETFKTIYELEIKLFDYINWYNNIRIHSSLNYVAPAEYEKKKSKIEKLVRVKNV